MLAYIQTKLKFNLTQIYLKNKFGKPRHDRSVSNNLYPAENFE